MTAKKAQKTRWSRVIAVWIAALGIAFYTTDINHLPAEFAAVKIVQKAYNWKDGIDSKASAGIEPAAGDNETGYKTEDRRELDSLISRGNYDE